MKKISQSTAYVIVTLVFTALIGIALAFTLENPRYDLILSSGNLLIKSFFYTIGLSLVTLFFALIFGFVLFVMNRSQMVFVKATARVFGEIIMGTPLLVMIFLVVYPLGQVLSIGSKVCLGVLAMVLYNSPYIANAYESTAAVVGSEQYTIMSLYDFKWHQRYRYIILPQIIKPFIPSLVNNLSSVIKGSALLNVIAIGEITYMTTIVANRSYAIIEGYYVMWVLYLLVTIPLSLLASYVGKKVST